MSLSTPTHLLIQPAAPQPAEPPCAAGSALATYLDTLMPTNATAEAVAITAASRAGGLGVVDMGMGLRLGWDIMSEDPDIRWQGCEAEAAGGGVERCEDPGAGVKAP